MIKVKKSNAAGTSLKLMLVLALLMLPQLSDACTSVIVAGKATASGRPMLYKNRDTGDLNNAVEYFKGPRYTFIGLVNGKPVKEVWAGTNEVGFSIMNTASYNIKDDDVPNSKMDGEGRVMYQALGCCATLADFEHYLDTLKRPMGVETNFGVIDAKGGAAYYEVNNHKWIKYDVNDPSVAPKGYRVVTNFCFAGRKEDAMGVERFLTASAVMDECYASGKVKQDIDHHFFFNKLSRSYRQEKLGVTYDEGKNFKQLGRKNSGFVVDQDFIPRRITSAAIVVEGVLPGQNPLQTVMWSLVGYPSCSVALPLFVGDGDHIPAYLQRKEAKYHSDFCNTSLSIKEKYVFTEKVSNGKQYMRLDAVLKGREGRPALKMCGLMAEKEIDKSFYALYNRWTSGELSDKAFYAAYDQLSPSFFAQFKASYAPFLK